MDKELQKVLRDLHGAYLDGNGHALIQAIRFCLKLAEPAPQWVVQAVADAEAQWINGDTREFAEPWGLTRRKGWQQRAHQTRSKPDERFGGLSRRGALLKRTLDLIYPRDGRALPKSDVTFELVASEFSAHGVKASEVKAAFNEWKKLHEIDGLGDSSNS